MPATTFSAWGTYVYVATREASDLTPAVATTTATLAEVDRACSRFRATSDLSLANARAGRWTRVDPLLVSAVRVAVSAAQLTGGLVHPLLGRSLVALGYDRDFALLTDTGVTLPAAPPPLDAWQDIGVTDEAVRVPAMTALDLGATGKAYAADLVAGQLAAVLEGPALVSVGGDLTVSRPDERPWPVAVSERPGGPAVRVWLESGGLATSSTRVRRWTRRGAAYHHLLDPRTGLPVAETWTTVSCLGATAVGANTASTAAMVLGAAAPGWLEAHRVSARLVDGEGGVRRTGHWPADVAEVA